METNPQSIRIPQIDIIQDECCRFVNELNPKVLKPIKITSVNPEELQLTQHRIKELAETLHEQLSKPFAMKYEDSIIKWASYSFILLISSITVYYVYRYGIFKILGTMLSKTIICLTPCR